MRVLVPSVRGYLHRLSSQTGYQEEQIDKLREVQGTTSATKNVRTTVLGAVVLTSWFGAISIGAQGVNEPVATQVVPVQSLNQEDQDLGSESGSVPVVLGVEQAPAVFLKAAEAYQGGDYTAASGLYQDLIEAGFDSGDLRYNLGNSLLRSGELGRAIAEYRRAQLHAPRDQDVRANLNFARSTIKDLVAPPEPAPWAKTFLFWHYGLSMKETLRLAICSAGVFWCLVAAYLLIPRMRSRWPLAVLLVAVLALTASLFVRWRYPQRIAVVVPAQTDVFSGTDVQSRVIFNLHAGTELAITSTDSTWTQFRMPDGQRGWLPSEHLEVVDPRGRY